MRRPRASGEPPPSSDPRCNLTVSVSSFVGRDHELRDGRRFLDTARLLTLTGTGGVGKTRLALRLAREVLEAYPDGVCLVELAPVGDPRRVARTVAVALGLQERAGTSALHLVAEALRSRNTLLVLDNCEHVLNASAIVAAHLLRTCTSVRILATSRQPLGIGGEQVWRIPALTMPEAPDTRDRVARSDAARLFVERAVAAEPKFTLTHKTAPAVAAICRRLDGIPLALELAAARAGLLAVEQIATRLDDRFRLLVGGSRTEPGRQQTLRAAIAWSYDLLSGSEQTLFDRLSVFVGGWSLEAVETACADDDLPREAILNLLGQLVDKSLVQTEFEPDGSVRYRLLETLRVFGWEHLQNRGEVDELRCRHLDLFVRLAEQGGVALQGPRQAAWLQRLETEHENLRAALRWAEERPNPKAGLRIAGALGRFWGLHGHLGEGRRWTDLFLQRTLGPTWTHVATLRANALLAASSLAFKQGDFKAVQNLAEEGCSLSRAVRDEGATPTWLVLLGHVARVRGELDRAVALFEQALAFERQSGNQWGLAGALQALGLAVGARGEDERATALHAESLALYRVVGDHYGSSSELFWLGQQACGRGDEAGANRLFEQTLTELRTLHDQRNIAFVLHALGGLARKNGQYARAETLHAEGLAQSQQCADMEGVRVGLQACAQLAATRGLPKRAARLFGSAEALSESLGVHPSPTERSEHEQLVRAARRRLDVATFAATWAEGRVLPIEQAVAYALAGGGPAGADRGVWGQSSPDLSGPTLTPREYQVAFLVGRGLTNRQIATQLVFTESTAAKHVEHILDKLGLNSRVQISAWATELRLREARSD